MTEPARRANMRMRYGVHRVLEEEADALIYAQVRKIKKHSENDILTPWKEKDRRKHEIYVPTGVPDAANRLGIYHRAYNAGRPELNSREGAARLSGGGKKISADDGPTPSGGGGTDSLHSFVWGDTEHE